MQKQQYQTAIYIRISKEDAEKEAYDSVSIVNQRNQINAFISKEHPEFQVYKEYVDDGYTGINFDRPAIKQLLEDIKLKKINCIVVKDLSRFGRNYIETGRYIEQIFPFLGVRFISINDNYDSVSLNQENGFLIPFKNLINDAYVRDISLKRKSQVAIRYKHGDFIGAFPVYGYLRSETDKHKLVIDPYAAQVVKDIFKWKIEGHSNQAIADKLNAMGVLSPYEYKKSLGWAYATSFKAGDVAKWSPQTVRRILHNQKYIGHMVQGMEGKPNYKVKKKLQKPESEWIIVEDTHEPIISKEDFQLVKRLMGADTRTSPNRKEIYLFSGLLKCGSCQKSMVRKPQKAYVYYVCRSHKRSTQLCAMNGMINEEKLKQCVLHMIQKQMDTLMVVDDLLNYIYQLPLSKGEIQKVDMRLKKKQDEYAYYSQLEMGLYEDYKSGVLSQENFQMLQKKYKGRIAEIRKTLSELDRELESMMNQNEISSKWIQDFMKYGKISELNRSVVISLIKEIIIYNKNTIEIHFTFQSEFETALRLIQDAKKLDLLSQEQLKKLVFLEEGEL